MSATAGRLLGPPVARLFAVDAPPPPRSYPQGVLDHDGADWASFAEPCVRLFLADETTPLRRLVGLLADAWDYDALTALKLVCQQRGLRGTGKEDREGFYAAALWMHRAHPQTLNVNLAAFAEFGYIKDFPELLYRLVKGFNVRKQSRAKSRAWAQAQAQAQAAPALLLAAGRKRARSDAHDSAAVGPEPAATRTKHPSDKVLRVASLAAQALHMYNGDTAYRHLFDCVADFFADRLRSDLDRKAAGEDRKIGLAAKWCPSPDSSFDQATLLCEAIARRLFPNPNNNADPQQEEHYVYRVLGRLRREVLVPLRKVLQLPELYMCDQRWSELPYNRVASDAMKRYKEIFMEHDNERFTQFLADRQAREASTAAAAAAVLFKLEADVLPHKIVADMAKLDGRPGWKGRVLWHQFMRSFVEGPRNGLFRNCLAVCDLSDGMRGTRRDVCVAVGLFVSELGVCSKDVIYPFDTTSPCVITGAWSIKDKLNVIQKLHCDNKKIDLRAVFDRILHEARRSGIGPEKMIRTIFVIASQEFEQVVVRPWRQDYKAVYEAFIDAGFGFVVPQVVYWNLQGERYADLTSMRDGVMRLSGFSEDFFRLFLDEEGIVTPEVEMRASIGGPNFDKLCVVD